MKLFCCLYSSHPNILHSAGGMTASTLHSLLTHVVQCMRECRALVHTAHWQLTNTSLEIQRDSQSVQYWHRPGHRHIQPTSFSLVTGHILDLISQDFMTWQDNKVGSILSAINYNIKYLLYYQNTFIFARTLTLAWTHCSICKCS